jgi:hypothetical protein
MTMWSKGNPFMQSMLVGRRIGGAIHDYMARKVSRSWTRCLPQIVALTVPFRTISPRTVPSLTSLHIAFSCSPPLPISRQ